MRRPQADARPIIEPQPPSLGLLFMHRQATSILSLEVVPFKGGRSRSISPSLRSRAAIELGVGTQERYDQSSRVISWFKRRGFLDAAAAADMLAWENAGFLSMPVSESRSSTAACRAISRGWNTCCGIAPGPPLPSNGCPCSAAQTAASPASALCCRDTRPPTGSARAAGGSPRDRVPTASSISRRLSLSTPASIRWR
jgi:hypothetical protein